MPLSTSHAAGEPILSADINAIAAGVNNSQPLDPDLTAIAALDSATAGALATDGAGWVRKTYAQLKTALGLVKADVGLGSVDNTSDLAKPVSTAQQAALDLKAPLASPALTGSPTAPTQTAGDSSTKIATTAFSAAAIAAQAATDSGTYLSPIGRTAAKAAVIAKPSGDGGDGIIDWVSEDAAGYLLHLTASGSAWGSTSGGLIGLGVDAGVGAGIVVSVKTSNDGGGGIYLDNQATVSGTSSFGMKGSQKSTAAPLVKLEQALGGTAPALVLQPLVAGTGQVLMQMLGTSGTPFWWVRADTGEQVMTTSLSTIGSLHTTYATGNAAGTYLQTSTTTGESGLRMYRDTGGGTFYAWQIRTNVDALQITSNGASAGTDGSEAAHVVMSFQDNKVGFYGTTPVIQAAAIASPTADVTSLKTAVDAIRAALTGIGVTL